MANSSISDQAALGALTPKVLEQTFNYTPQDFEETREKLMRHATGKKLATTVKPIVLLAMRHFFATNAQKARIVDFANWAEFRNIHRHSIPEVNCSPNYTRWRAALVNAAILFIYHDSGEDMIALRELLSPMKQGKIGKHEAVKTGINISFKTLLNNWALKNTRAKAMPRYNIVSTSEAGIICEVVAYTADNNELRAKGECCPTKKEAEESAAAALWQQMIEDEIVQQKAA